VRYPAGVAVWLANNRRVTPSVARHNHPLVSGYPAQSVLDAVIPFLQRTLLVCYFSLSPAPCTFHVFPWEPLIHAFRHSTVIVSIHINCSRYHHCVLFTPFPTCTSYLHLPSPVSVLVVYFLASPLRVRGIYPCLHLAIVRCPVLRYSTSVHVRSCASTEEGSADGAV
jgi:hypothetical protein